MVISLCYAAGACVRAHVACAFWEAASHLGLAKDSAYRWFEQKGLPAHRVGRLWKLKLSEIEKDFAR